MSFLMKYIGGFFDWWKGFTKLPTVLYGDTAVNWSMVAFWLLVITGMVVFLPGGLFF